MQENNPKENEREISLNILKHLEDLSNKINSILAIGLLVLTITGTLYKKLGE